MPDVLIVGGGVIGHALAVQLLLRCPDLAITVIERDPTYRIASSALSVGGVRQQFGTAINVAICRDAVAFYEDANDQLSLAGERVDIGWHQNGYLFLATAKTLAVFAKRAAMARSLGVQIDLLTPGEAGALVPDLSLHGLAGASFCRTDGYLDPYLVLMAFRNKALALGARTVIGDACKLCYQGDGITGVRLADGHTLAASQVVVAAGAWSAELLQPTGLHLPVRPYRRQVYVVKPELPLREPLPLTIDPSGLHFRPETGGRLLVAQPVPSDGPHLPLWWDRGAFENHMWECLATRVPSLERLRLESGWSGYYDDNAEDHNAIVGQHPEISRLYMITGFSGHGLMQCPATTRGLAELMLYGRYQTLDLTPLRPQRFQEHDLIVEEAVI